MRNVTITLSEELARFAKVYAANQMKSVSRLVAELLGQLMTDDKTYSDARRSYLNRGPLINPDMPNAPLPKRDEIYDRQVFRRY